MSTSRPPRSLVSLLAFLLAGSALLLTAVLVLAVRFVATDDLKRAIGNRVAERAQYSAVQLDVSMYERYREVQNLAARPELAAPLTSAASKRALLEQLQRSYPLYAWLGLADNAGTVLAGAGGLLEGADVSQRPWFAEIGGGARVHDVHDAKLLAALVPPDPEAGAPQRFVDFSFPIYHADGSPAGVLGAHLSWAWARQMQEQFANPSGGYASTLIVSSAGLVLSGPRELIGTTIKYPSLAAAQSQQRGYLEETWSDGNHYLVGYARTSGHAPYPGLGWVVLARQQLFSAYGELYKLRRNIALAGVAVALLFSLLGWLLARKVTRPLLLAAQGAHEIELGQRQALDAARSGYGELDKLISAFNGLLRRLGEKREQLNAANAELERRVAERTADLERSLAELHAKELRIRTILATAQDAFVGMDGEGRVTDWNAQAERMFGWRLDEIVGQFLADMIIAPDKRQAHHDGLAHFKRTGEQVMLGRRLLLTAMRRDGAEFPIEMTIGQVLVGGAVSFGAFINDISERQEAQRRLAESERFLRAVTDNVPAVIAYIDRDLRFRFANRAHQFMFGLDPEAMLGRTMSEVAGAAIHAKMAPYVAEALAGRALRFEVEFSERWPGYYIVEYIPDRSPDGQVRGFHVMVMDISARRAAELAAADSEVKAVAASRAKSEFVANMSHEIRTPMNAVLGVAHLLTQTPLTPEQRELVEMIRTCGKSLVQIINDILDFSKIEAGKIDIAAAPFALADIVDVISIALLAKGAGGEVDYLLDVGPGLERAYLGDALRLQQIVLNLVSNAVKFTEHGSVAVELRGEAIDARQMRLRVRVRDTGIGMTAEQQARLFGAFEQADSSTSRRFGGTGLGLTIAHQLADLMGGSLAVTSVLGQGSEFVFSVPLALAEGAGARPLPAGVTRLNAIAVADGAGAAQAGAAPLVSLHGLRILLVEDNALNQVVARGMLEPSGAKLTLASNGRQAIDCFRAAPGGFDLVLMDVQMPVMDGFAATAALRRDWGVSVPIIAMSAGVLETEQAQCRQAGMDDFIAKPVDYDQMMAVIARHAAAGRAAALAAAVPAARVAGVIDLSVLLRFSVDGSAQRAALVQLLTRVRDHAQADFAAAAAALAAGDPGAAAKQLHALRGSVGSLGAARFAAASLALEVALKEGGLGAADTLVARAAAELDVVVAALARWLGATERVSS